MSKPIVLLEGIVIFYATTPEKTLTEIGRTSVMPYESALHIYAETPNPASQLLHWASESEKLKVIRSHKRNLTDRVWLDDLYDCL